VFFLLILDENHERLLEGLFVIRRRESASIVDQLTLVICYKVLCNLVVFLMINVILDVKVLFVYEC
jgi:hypothetical protein